MPRFDGTGPRGMGPLTGRAMGYCTGARRPVGGYYGRGGGRGRARGFGVCNRLYYYDDAPLYDEKPSKELLLNQKKFLEEELASINKQIDEYK
jgi:hypothetical protein